jgi:ribokinase
MLVVTLLLASLASALGESISPSCAAAARPIVVIGSVNVDLTVRVARPPSVDETVLATSPTLTTAVGGKGANQAIAAARLSAGSRPVRFVGRFGNDAHASVLETELRENGVDVSSCGHVDDLPSGQGFVMLSPDGAASSVVIGGANTAWPSDERTLRKLVTDAVHGAAVVLLQREVPERVNVAAAKAANAANVPVILDAGGANTALSRTLLELIDYLCPNETELMRLTGMRTETDDDVVTAAKTLLKHGANHILVTLGGRGSVSVSASEVKWHEPIAVPKNEVLDATAAGDAFRAAIAVSIAESGSGELTERGAKLAAAAGACAVRVVGAMPSLPTREAADALLSPEDRSLKLSSSCQATSDAREMTGTVEECPLLFGSRLNSMRARPDLFARSASASLWGLGKSSDVKRISTLDMIQRLGTASGITSVDINYPQHLEGLKAKAVSTALAAAGITPGSIAVRFPATISYRRGGAFTNPDQRIRAEAVKLIANACEWANAINASGGVVIWPQFDGYDYHFQVNYTETWERGVDALRDAVDHPRCEGVKISYEFKPTDESSRFAIVPSTAAALALVREVNRPGRFGLTLDAGHLIAAGENPAQSAASVARANALFGFHIGDVHSKLGAEDGLAFGSVHASLSLELVYWLRAVRYDGVVYFDTFPEAEDPVREAEYNVRTFKRMWNIAGRLERAGMGSKLAEHDAMGSLELIEKGFFAP